MKYRLNLKLVLIFLALTLTNLSFASAQTTSLESNISVDKSTCVIGEIVNIRISSIYLNNQYKLEIVTSEFIYRYLDLLDEDINFIPRHSGIHQIVIIDTDSNTIATSIEFTVNGGENLETVVGEQPNPENTDSIVDKSLQDTWIQIRNSKNIFSTEKIKILQKKIGNSNNPSSEPTKDAYDVEFSPENNAVKKIVFKNMDIDKELKLGLEDIKDLSKFEKINKDVRKVYAIDPSLLEFSEATVTSIAQGNELFKCKDWNFETQTCHGSWIKLLDIIPNQEYSFTLTQKDPAFLDAGPPVPHTVRGKVVNSDGITGVENGIAVTINDTNSSDFVETEVYSPPFDPGWYAVNINGSDNDSIIVFARNSTHYGTNATTLQTTTTPIHITMNNTRPSETNVTIVTPSNDTIANTSSLLNLTANITIFGGSNGISCNATISFTNQSVLNITSEENLTNVLGDIVLGDSVTTSWNLSVLGIGITNVSVQAKCANQDISFDNVNTAYVSNITTLDTSPPVVTLISPENNSQTFKNLTFFYNVTDHSTITNCSLILNDTTWVNDSNIIKDTTLNFTLNLDPGSYNYYINCTDNTSNNYIGSSETRYFNVTDVDLIIFADWIIFSNLNPVEGQQITINATILNIGTENLTHNFTVQFYEGDPDSTGTQIESNLTITGLNSSSNKTARVNWTAGQGTFDIYVIVDAPLTSNGSILELNESNNAANRSIFISANNIYYGEVTADIVLDNSNLSVYNWFNDTNINGNIYVIDTDSSISWSNLIALGINLTYNASLADFNYADNALNLTNLTDSINKTYTLNGQVRNQEVFYVYSNNITNVSIVNSTNTSDFVTGILWDSNDINPGYYNGSQDLIFITQLNNDKIGSYGLYDYELRVPANLRKYIIPNNENTLTFYVELT